MNQVMSVNIRILEKSYKTRIDDNFEDFLDLLGDFSTPWVSEGVKTISNSENISKTSFFLLDLGKH